MNLMGYFNDLVWVGNTLLPRWLPLAVLALGVVLPAGAFWSFWKLMK